MRALVVDDSRTTRLVIGNILRELGMEVVEAGDGAEAQDQLARHPDVDIALVDWNMPRMSGLELVRAVRSRGDYDGVRILMVTTETEAGRVAEALAAGANEYLMKPFDRDALVSKLGLLDLLPE